ncbi:hypothetical protein C8R43DRAFT_984790 [Mycena crocata]|nr:hypothetical protein C8R43DRAFT_984790 [Mycena crocata]
MSSSSSAPTVTAIPVGRGKRLHPRDLEEAQIHAVLLDLEKQEADLEREQKTTAAHLAFINQRLVSVRDEITNNHRALVRVHPEHIPAEVLASIFALAENEAPLSVSRVCHYWRNVALAAPSIWSRMTWDFSCRPKHDEHLWLARSSCSISAQPAVRISGFRIPFPPPISLHIGRIHCLEMTECELHELYTILPAFSTLASLDVTTRELDDDRDTNKPPRGSLELPQLRALTLRSVDSFEMEELMSVLKTPALRSLELNFPRVPRDEWEFPWDDFADLNAFQTTSCFDLEHLAMHNTAIPFDPARFPSFPSFPCLRTLCLSQSEHADSFDMGWLFQVPERFPQLEELELQARAPWRWYGLAMQAARIRGPLTRFSLPTSGPRALKRMKICNIDTRARPAYDCGLPTSWGPRIREFAARGLVIQFEPFQMDKEETESDWDEFAESWPKNSGAESEPSAEWPTVYFQDPSYKSYDSDDDGYY